MFPRLAWRIEATKLGRLGASTGGVFDVDPFASLVGLSGLSDLDNRMVEQGQGKLPHEDCEYTDKEEHAV